MKKSILVLVVLALVAAPMFAETTVSASGEFEFKLNLDLSDGGDMINTSDSGKAGFGLAAKTGEFTTFGAKVEATDLSLSSIAIDDDMMITSSSSTVMDVLKVNRFTMTQDLGGIFALDGMGLKYEVGYLSLGGSNKAKQSGVKDDIGTNGTGSYAGMKFMLDLNGTGINLGILPSTYDDEAVFGVDVTTSVAMANIAAYFILKGDNATGVNASLAIMDGLSIGVGVDVNNLSAIAMDATLNAKYSAGPLAVGVGYLLSGFALDGGDVMAASGAGVKVDYKIADDLSGYAKVEIPLADAASLSYDAGIKKTIDTIGYTVGFNGNGYVKIGGKF